MPSSLSINASQQGDSLEYVLTGRVDTTTAPQLSANIHLQGILHVTFNIEAVDYISSAGLRVFLQTQTAMNKAGGTMRITGCQTHIKDLFEAVGFTSIMDIS